MSNKTLIRILLLVIVSAAFILARYGSASADPLEGQVKTISEQKTDDQQSVQSKSSGNLFNATGENDSMVIPLLKLFGALVVVVAAIYGFLLILRKMMGSKLSGNRSNSLIEVLETTHVGQKKSVSLVRYHDRSVLIGVADNSISVLAELDSVETGKILSGVSAGSPSNGFENILHHARRKIGNIGMKKIKAALVSNKSGESKAA
jgi:flagellar biosynthetic protein FliO